MMAKMDFHDGVWKRAGVGRFASADPNLSVRLIPEPGAAIGYNRYAYANLNPIAYSDPSGHLSQEEIETYFGYGNKNEMLEDGWLEELVNWLWDDTTTWGMTFAYDGSDSVAMLMLFEIHHAYSNAYEGGFYGVFGSNYGEQIGVESIINFDASDDNAVRLESKYWGRWDEMEPKMGSNNTPYYVPAVYVDMATWPMVGAVGTTVGGAALLVCVIAEPCGVIAGGAAATVAGIAGATSTTIGATVLVRDLMTDNWLGRRYPMVLLPAENILGQLSNRTGGRGFGPPKGIH